MTTSEEYSENVGTLWAQLGAIPVILRFLCGGVELSDVPAAVTEPEATAVEETPVDVSAEAVPVDVMAADDDAASESSSDADWEMRKEMRYISPVVLERLAAIDACLPLLASARVLAHLASVLHENAIQGGISNRLGLLRVRACFCCRVNILSSAFERALPCICTRILTLSPMLLHASSCGRLPLLHL